MAWTQSMIGDNLTEVAAALLWSDAASCSAVYAAWCQTSPGSETWLPPHRTGVGLVPACHLQQAGCFCSVFFAINLRWGHWPAMDSKRNNKQGGHGTMPNTIKACGNAHTPCRAVTNSNHLALVSWLPWQHSPQELETSAARAGNILSMISA